MNASITTISGRIAAHAGTPTPLRITPPDDAAIYDVVRQAQRGGLALVTDGARIYLTPRVMPGEFRVGVREAA